jgi:hypothetical protein
VPFPTGNRKPCAKFPRLLNAVDLKKKTTVLMIKRTPQAISSLIVDVTRVIGANFSNDVTHFELITGSSV